LIHGAGDQNVHLQNTDSLMKAFLKEGKDAEMVVYPAQDHGIYEGRDTTWHLSQRLAEFFERNL
jgi:dipeptidyl-peptidase-4